MSPALLTDTALETAMRRVNAAVYDASYRGNQRELARQLVERAWVNMRWRDRFPAGSLQARCWHGLMCTDLLSASHLADRLLGREPEQVVPPQLTPMWH